MDTREFIYVHSTFIRKDCVVVLLLTVDSLDHHVQKSNSNTTKDEQKGFRYYFTKASPPYLAHNSKTLLPFSVSICIV